MKPTLYAEELPTRAANKDWLAALSALAKVLPRRCPDKIQHDPKWQMYTACLGGCGERGWLYPDTPDWWAERKRSSGRLTVQLLWELHCRDSWRAMGILEEESN